MPLLAAANLHKTYSLGRVPVPVLRGVDVAVEAGEIVAILGQSGSGKSTLLHLLGGLDRQDAVGADIRACKQCSHQLDGSAVLACPKCGTRFFASESDKRGAIVFDNRRVDRLSHGQLDEFRRRDVGFVFQFYHLLPELSVLDNVLIGAMIREGVGYSGAAAGAKTRAMGLLETVGLSHRLGHRPAELSGGERQRVAIARALINKPRVLLADEPTGNLDRETGAKILDMLMDLRREHGHTMLIVTHDQATAGRADRVLRMVDGKIGA
jgi:lipoprotein-releasing system ATP-binding protein